MPSSFLPLPSYTFIMSDHTTHERALTLTNAIASAANSNVIIENFLAPIHDALQAMFELSYADSFGGKFSEHTVRNKPTRDLIIDLERWFIEQFGEHELGRMALERCFENHEVTDAPIVFRDATRKHIEAFVDDLRIARHEMLFIHMEAGVSIGGRPEVWVPLAASDEEMLDMIRAALR